MAIDLTYDEVLTQVGHVANMAIALYGELTDQVTLIDSYRKVVEGRFASSVGANAYRAGLSSAMAPIRTMLLEHLRDLAQVIDTPYAPPSAKFFEAWHTYCIDNAKTIKGRGLTYGSIAGSAGTGNLTIARLAVDWANEPLEDIALGTVTAEVLQDQNSGAEKWRPKLLLRMGTPRLDWCEDGDSNLEATLDAACGDDLLVNASFGSLDLANGEIAGWEANVAIDETNFTDLSSSCHRTAPEERASPGGTDAPHALQANVSAVVSQEIRESGARLDENTPLGLAAAYKVMSSATEGTAKIRAGTHEATAVITAASSVQWHVLLLTLNQYSWLLRNANEDELKVDLEWLRTGGALAWDDVQCKPMTRGPDGLWYFAYCPNAGGATPIDLLRGWVRTFANSLTATDSEIMRVLSWMFGMGRAGGARLVGPIGVNLPTDASPTNADV